MIGNFRTRRRRRARADRVGRPHDLARKRYGLVTERYDIRCGRSRSVQYDLRDVDFRPDGSNFVTVATGGLAPPDALCDAAARWETDRPGPHQQPTWTAFTGNDSVYSVALNGSAVYVEGTSAGSTTRTASTSRAREPSAVNASLRSTPATGCR